MPARRATLAMGDRAACRPFLLIFFFFSCVVCDLTNLPYAGSSPGYAAYSASHQALLCFLGSMPGHLPQ